MQTSRVQKLALAVSALATIAMLGAGCGSTGSTNTSSNSAGQTSNTQSASTHQNKEMPLSNAKVDAKYFDNTIQVEVKKVTLDFFPSSGSVLSDPKDDGKQFVRVELAVTNTGAQPFKLNDTAFKLTTSDNKDGDTYTFYINSSNANDFLVPEGQDDKELKQGETATGALYFEAPASDTLENMKLVYEGYNGTDSQNYVIPFYSAF